MLPALLLLVLLTLPQLPLLPQPLLLLRVISKSSQQSVLWIHFSRNNMHCTIYVWIIQLGAIGSQTMLWSSAVEEHNGYACCFDGLAPLRGTSTWHSSSQNHACSLPGQSHCNEKAHVEMLNIAWRRLSWKAMYSASMWEVSIACL